jgi:hypothetical protein
MLTHNHAKAFGEFGLTSIETAPLFARCPIQLVRADSRQDR